MPIQNLFDANGAYTEEALQLEKEMHQVIQPFFTNKRFSAREVYTIFTLAVAEAMYNAQLGWDYKAPDPKLI